MAIDVKKLKQQWEEWKGCPEHALWPEIIEGFDALLEILVSPTAGSDLVTREEFFKTITPQTVEHLRD